MHRNYKNPFLGFKYETIALFLIITLNWLSLFKINETTLQIIIWATITQVAAMLMFIVQNLYPKEKYSDISNDELKKIKDLLNSQKN